MTTRTGVIPIVCALAAAVCAASAHGATELVITGRGWGHGVGMSQWGAYGYAQHGWSWPRILAHYYPGTRLSSAANSRVRVLLATGQPRAQIACAGGIRVSDASGRTWPLPPGSYGVGPGLKLPVAHRAVKMSAAHRHHASTELVPVRKALRSPVAFDCPATPLTWNGRAYHGVLVVRSRGKRMSIVNALPLEEYVQGVVGGEMPQRWSMAALEAQAVAARSYALATLKPRAHFDLFSDARSQVYGGIAFETQRTDLAVQRTAGRILTWDGRVATTFFFSTSGGRTANVEDVWPQYGAVPYLRSVDDPYDGGSPHHAWGPLGLSAQKIAAVLHAQGGDVKVERNASGRVSSVVLGSTRIDGFRFEQELGLASTWFDVGELSLTSSRAHVAYGGRVGLVARADGVRGGALLQRRIGAGPWVTLKHVGGGTSVTVEPRAQTLYRLTGGGVRGPEVTVAVAPLLHVSAAGVTLLAGSVEPRSRGGITVWRRVAGTWKIVARPLLGGDGVFRTPLRLRPGDYRVTLDAAGPFASASASLDVTPRLLASLRH